MYVYVLMLLPIYYLFIIFVILSVVLVNNFAL